MNTNRVARLNSAARSLKQYIRQKPQNKPSSMNPKSGNYIGQIKQFTNALEQYVREVPEPQPQAGLADTAVVNALIAVQTEVRKVKDNANVINALNHLNTIFKDEINVKQTNQINASDYIKYVLNANNTEDSKTMANNALPFFKTSETAKGIAIGAIEVFYEQLPNQTDGDVFVKLRKSLTALKTALQKMPISGAQNAAVGVTLADNPSNPFLPKGEYEPTRKLGGRRKHKSRKFCKSRKTRKCRR